MSEKSELNSDALKSVHLEIVGYGDEKKASGLTME